MSEPIAETLLEAMRLRAQMRAQGVSVAEADHYVAGVLRTTLRPHARRWEAVCAQCQDTGWRLLTAPAAIYGGRGVEWAERCVCARGRALLAKPAEDDATLAQIGRTSRPMTKVGR